ncbi:MAG: hypothetical protein H6673_15490 [Anaerolineales bacterium]|nr:hypothetical protein [Anaerolineales bacterium]
MNMLKLIEFIQKATIPSDRFIQPFCTKVFDRKGISYYTFFRSTASEESTPKFKFGDDYELFLKNVAELITQGSEIYIALGEMGHTFIDSSWILDALRFARTNNKANIKILHGPHVDPQTSEVFSLVRKQIVQARRMAKYRPHHFILIKDKDGVQWHFADENPHNEGLWQSISGETVNQYRSVVRVWYLLKGSKNYGKSNLYKTFMKRWNEAETSLEHPGSLHDYSHVWLRVLWTLARNAYYRSIKQPIAIFFDKSNGIISSFGNSFLITLLSVSRFMLAICLVLINLAWLPGKFLLGKYRVEMISSDIMSHVEETIESPLFDAVERARGHTNAVLSLRMLQIALANIALYYEPVNDLIFAPGTSDETMLPILQNIVNDYPIQDENKERLSNEILRLIDSLKGDDKTYKQAATIIQHFEEKIQEVDAKRERSPEVYKILSQLRENRESGYSL